MKLSFYRVDSDYCNYLRTYDPCVPYTMEDKSPRPFIGIVLIINNFFYYAPLTSPKPKHLHMKNQLDFLKINTGIWGAINFNNMIPVHDQCLQKVDMKLSPEDSDEETHYKNLLANQLSWCETNSTSIHTHAEKLHTIISRGKGRPALVSRCCNFPVDESQMLVYCQMHNFPVISAETKSPL